MKEVMKEVMKEEKVVGRVKEIIGIKAGVRVGGERLYGYKRKNKSFLVRTVP